MCANKQIEVCAGIIRKGGFVLVCGRAPGSELEGNCEFPGGKVEPGESLNECLRRELREELGVSALCLDEIYTASASRPDKNILIHFIRAVLEKDSPEPRGMEGQIVRMVPLDSLDKINLLPADARFAELLSWSAGILA